MTWGGPSHRTVLLAKTGALVVLFALAPLAWFSDIRTSLTFLSGLTRFGKAPAVYGAVVLLSFVGLSVTPFLRSTAIRSVLLAIFLSAYALDHVVVSLSGSRANGALIRTLWQSRALAGEAIGAYQTVLVQNIAAIALLGVVLAWPFRRGLRNTYALLPIASLILVALHYSSWETMVEGYPSPLAIPARVAFVLTAPATHNDLPLEPVPSGHVAPSRFRTIVFVMDESVRGDYLSINSRGMDTTPFLEMSADRVVNFGIAIAGANCSFQSRWMMRRGVRAWQLPEQRTPSKQASQGILEGPRTTMWQFARAAGFKTVYIDAWQSSAGSFHSGVTPEELTFVDHRIGVESAARYGQDPESARTLVSLSKSKERTFVYIDKIGAHFPYDTASAPDFNRFTRSDGGRFTYSTTNRDELIGSYKNAIAWSVDGFFRDVLQNADLNDTLIIYTSDHGQNLGDGGYAWGHCSATPHPSEVWVPLLAFSGNEEFRRALSTSAGKSFNEATHFEIFPTLLIAMGYDRTWVTDVYGPSLLAIPAGQPRRFLIGDVISSGFRTWMDVGKPGSPSR